MDGADADTGKGVCQPLIGNSEGMRTFLAATQALASALVQQEVPQAVRKQIALSLARLQSQQVNPHVGQVLAALPPDQAHALHELTSQPLLPA